MPDCFVRVKLFVGNAILQLVDLTAMGPVIVETVPVADIQGLFTVIKDQGTMLESIYARN